MNNYQTLRMCLLCYSSGARSSPSTVAKQNGCYVTGLSKLPVCGHRCLLIGFLTKSSNVTQPIRSEDRSSMLYNEQCVGRCCERPCLLSRFRPHAQPTGCVWTAHLWPELFCPAWHLIYLKPITRLLP